MNPYSRLAEIMREQGRAVDGYDMETAVVTQIQPLAIKIGETDVKINLYCNPALLLGLNPQALATEETALKQCLNSFYSAFKLSVGDMVLVQQIWDATKRRNIFYVICKAVKI